MKHHNLILTVLSLVPNLQSLRLDSEQEGNPEHGCLEPSHTIRLFSGSRPNGAERVRHLALDEVARRITDMYYEVTGDSPKIQILAEGVSTEADKKGFTAR